MSEGGGLSTARIWFNIIWVLVILYAFGRGIMGGIPHSISSTTEPPPSPNYHRQFCSDRKTVDYSDSNPETIVVQLHDGCYGDRIAMPKAWTSWQVQLSSNVGDYLSLWCSEEPNPRRTVSYTGDPSGITVNCPPNHRAEFSTEGIGTFTLTRTQTDPNAAAEAEKQQAEIAQKNLEATYKLTPVQPSAGDHTGFSITVDQCFRVNENIHCKGTATNVTDARTMLELRGGEIVDDEGNTVPLAIPTGEWYFAGSQQERGEYLLPSVPVKFLFNFPDPHQNVKTINIEMKTCWYDRYVQATLVFAGVPVQ